LKQLTAIVQAAIEGVDGGDDGFEVGAFLAQGLCVFGFVPDAGFSQLQFNFGQAIFLFIVVKDTPEGYRCGWRSP